MATATEPRTIDESYSMALHTSDMTVVGGMVPEGHPNRAADVIIASGMAACGGRHQLGFALIAIRGEWDRCDKPAKRSEAFIEARAKELPDKRGRPDMKRARAEAIAWHARQMRERAMVLRGRSLVLGLLTEWAQRVGVDVDLLSPALFHFLAPKCSVCDGHGKVLRWGHKIETTCDHCRGSGEWPRPMGAHQIHDYFKDVMGKAKGGTVGRLRG